VWKDTRRLCKRFVKNSSGSTLTSRMKCVTLLKAKAYFGFTRKG
jgi:hypothetical protein